MSEETTVDEVAQMVNKIYGLPQDKVIDTLIEADKSLLGLLVKGNAVTLALQAGTELVDKIKGTETNKAFNNAINDVTNGLEKMLPASDKAEGRRVDMEMHGSEGATARRQALSYMLQKATPAEKRRLLEHGCDFKNTVTANTSYRVAGSDDGYSPKAKSGSLEMRTCLVRASEQESGKLEFVTTKTAALEKVLDEKIGNVDKVKFLNSTGKPKDKIHAKVEKYSPKKIEEIKTAKAAKKAALDPESSGLRKRTKGGR